MYCTTLRRRPSYASALPSLISADGLRLKESRLDTHHVAIPLSASPSTNAASTATERQLRVLLMSPSAVSEPKLPDTLDQIHRFTALTGGQDLAIVFLLNPPKTSTFVSAKQLTSATSESEADTKGVLAYTKLQAALLPRHDIPHVPTLPLASIEGLPELLKRHAAALSRTLQSVKATVSSPFKLLQLCTTEPPMDRQTAYFATDCFVNVRELASVCTEPLGDLRSSSPTPTNTMSQSSLTYNRPRDAVRDSGAQNLLRQLRGLVGEDRCQEMLEFWADEWVVD